MDEHIARLELAALSLPELRTLTASVDYYRHYARRQKDQAIERRCYAFKNNPSAEPQLAAQVDGWQAEEQRCKKLWEIVRSIHNGEVRRRKAEISRLRESSAPSALAPESAPRPARPS